MISQGTIEMLIAIHGYVSACVRMFHHHVSNVAITVCLFSVPQLQDRVSKICRFILLHLCGC